jgi:glycerophosphoryl diester phosphodiesterase
VEAAKVEADRMLVIGHRGARGLFPENTLEGFRAAAVLGVSAFELDVGMTGDGVVVVCHDLALNPDLTRDASRAWLAQPGPLIHSLTMAELARYDVGRSRPGSGVSLQFPDQHPFDGARIPSLASVLASLPDAMILIEVKTDPSRPDLTAPAVTMADAVLAVVDQAGSTARVVIESFDWRVPRHVARTCPEVGVAWLTRADTVRQPILWWDIRRSVDDRRSVPQFVAAAGGPGEGRIWAPDHADLSEGMVRQAHALGLAVIPWTVNDVEDMRRLADWQVDGLVSDRPDVVLARVGT